MASPWAIVLYNYWKNLDIPGWQKYFTPINAILPFMLEASHSIIMKLVSLINLFVN